MYSYTVQYEYVTYNVIIVIDVLVLYNDKQLPLTGVPNFLQGGGRPPGPLVNYAPVSIQTRSLQVKTRNKYEKIVQPRKIKIYRISFENRALK